MEYYEALKKKEVLSRATTCMILKGIMLSKISQSQRTNTVLFHPYEVSNVVKIIKIQSRKVVANGYGERGERISI